MTPETRRLPKKIEDELDKLTVCLNTDCPGAKNCYSCWETLTELRIVIFDDRKTLLSDVNDADERLRLGSDLLFRDRTKAEAERDTARRQVEALTRERDGLLKVLQDAPIPSATTTKYVRPGADVPTLKIGRASCRERV